MPTSGEETEEIIQLDPVFWMAYNPERKILCGIMDLPEKPGIVGIMLADALGHFANAYEGEGWDRKKAVEEIYSLFVAEMNFPTDTPRETTIEASQVRFRHSNDDSEDVP